MKFGLPQILRFNAVQGSYSPITNREVFDSQLTATDAESSLLESYFSRHGETIHVGNVRSNPQSARKRFRLWPSGDNIWLNLVYPKPDKSELRLYLATSRGFMPKEGDVWFLFVTKDDELWIGRLTKTDWRLLFDQVPPQRNNVSMVMEGPLIPEQNPALIKKRMELAKFQCEFNPSHRLFVARATGSRYVEVHHVIPKKFQAQFFVERQKDLTSISNLCCLCPWCHRAIHHGEEPLTRSILSKMFDIRNIGFHYGITKEDLFQLYSVEEIVREDHLGDDNPV